MDEYSDLSTAETLTPALLRQCLGAIWYARWQTLANAAAQWLAIALAEELVMRPALAPTEALTTLARRPDAKRALAGRDIDALLNQIVVTGLLPTRVGS